MNSRLRAKWTFACPNEVDGHRIHFQQYADASGFLITTERGAYEGESVAFSGGIGLVGAAAPLCSGLTRGTARPER